MGVNNKKRDPVTLCSFSDCDGSPRPLAILLGINSKGAGEHGCVRCVCVCVCAFVPVILNCTVRYSGCGQVVLNEYVQTLLHVPLGLSSLIILATCELLTLTHCIVSTLVR